MHVGLLGTEELTYRRFRVLLFHLPRESLFMQATLGEPARWSVTDYLLAHVIDAVNRVVHILASVYRGKGPRPKFIPFPRPGAEVKDKPLVLGRGKGMSVSEMREFLDSKKGGD